METDSAKPPAALLDALEKVLSAHPEIEVAILFGSLAAGTAGPGSDLDLGVAAERPLDAGQKRALIERLALAFGRAVDLVDLRTAGEPILGQILTRGHIVRRGAPLLAELIKRHVFAQADFVPYRERILRERLETWTGS